MNASTSTWIRRANADDLPHEEVAACLQSAQTAATCASDWRDIAVEYRDRLADIETALICLQRAKTERFADQIAGFIGREIALCHVAAGQWEQARAQCRELEEAFMADPDGNAYDVLSLAALYVNDFNDLDSAKRCVQLALDQADSASEFADVASAMADRLGDPDGAMTLANDAFAAAMGATPPDIWGIWTLANVLVDSLDQADAGASMLATALNASTTTSDCLTLARAFHCHFGVSPVAGSGFDKALAKARSLAQSATDHGGIAEVRFQCVGTAAGPEERAAMKTDLEAGLACAASDEDRRTVAFGFRAYLDDPERADAIIQPGLHPDDISSLERPLDGWTPDCSALLDRLRGRISESQLQAIAGLDYGSDFAQHMTALKTIAATGQVPHPLPWHPGEVVALERWGDGPEVDHWRRAFACTILATQATGLQFGGGTCETLAVLLDSCHHLGPDELRDLIGLATAIARAPELDETPVFALVVMLLAQAALNPADDRLADLVDQIEAGEQKLARNDYASLDDGWLLGTTFFNQRHPLWRQLSKRILSPVIETQPELTHLARFAQRFGRVG